METDYSKHTHFRWKIKWRLEHLGALGIMGEIFPRRDCFHSLVKLNFQYSHLNVTCEFYSEDRLTPGLEFKSLLMLYNCNGKPNHYLLICTQRRTTRYKSNSKLYLPCETKTSPVSVRSFCQKIGVLMLGNLFKRFMKSFTFTFLCSNENIKIVKT